MAGVLAYAAYSLLKGGRETVPSAETFTVTELLFMTNRASEAGARQSSVSVLLQEQIKRCLGSPEGAARGQRAAEALRAVEAAVATWPSCEAEVLVAQLAAGLTGAAAEDAERVAAALMEVTTVERRTLVMAAIALAATGLDSSDGVIRAAVNAAPSAERDGLRRIAAAPLDRLGAGADVAACRVVKACQLLGSQWKQPGQPVPLFHDVDGGEPPASRR